MAGTGSPSHSQHQHHDDDGDGNGDFLNKDPNATEPKEAESSAQQKPPHSETLETLDLPNPLQLPLDDQGFRNPQQPDEDALLVLDGDDQQLQQEIDHQSGTTHAIFTEPIILTDDTNHSSQPPPPPPPPLTSPTNPQRRLGKRKKTTSRNLLKRKKSMKKVENLIDILIPVPFIATKGLAFDKHKEVLKRLGLFEFSRIEFDRTIRTDLVAQLIVNYDPKKRCSYVNDYRINVNRADLARALKLPATKQEKGSSNVEEVDLDSELFSDEAIGFIEDFVSNWMLLHEDSWVMPTEIVNWTRCIKDGHPEKMDSASLIWNMVEKELNQRDKLVNCYYASHLQYLIRSQRVEIFEPEMEVEEVKDDDDGEGVADDGVAIDGEENVKAEEKEMNEEKEEKKENEEKEEKKENEKKEEKFSVVEEHNIELTLGPDVEEIVDEKVMKDDELMIDAEECKEEEVEVEEQRNWLLDEKNNLGEHFLQRCQSSDLNGYEERKPEDVDDEQIEQVEDEDEEEEAGERGEDGFDMEANDDSLDRDQFTNVLQQVEISHIPFGSQAELRGMSSMDLFGSRDGSFMTHGGPSLFGNGGKRMMEPEEDIHHLDGNNKRLKTDEMWDQKPNDFGFCMEQMQQWMEKAKMVYMAKERSYEDTHFSQQLAMNQLQERHDMMEIYIKAKDEELEKKHAEVFRLERELFLMGDLLAGYRKALNDTRFKFSEYRKRHALHEEPLYKDAGPGGLVLSTRELEKQRIKQEEDRARFVMLAKAVEEEFVYKLGMHHEKVSMMVDKLVCIENEVKKLKEISTQHKETQKPRDEHESSAMPEENLKPQDEQEILVDSEENLKHRDEQEFSVEPEETLKSRDEQKLCAEPEENQKPVDEQELSVEPEENQTSLAEQELSVEPEENQTSLAEQELSVEPEENQTSLAEQELSAVPEETQKSQDEVRENDTIMESVSPDADGLKEKGDGED